MKIRTLYSLFLGIVLAAVSCSRQDIPDYHEGYGYVQFKLYKEASYQASTKAAKTELEYLREACKVKVSMTYNGTEAIAQTLVLQQTDKEDAEFGLRSDKLMLYQGDYSIVNFTLYDVLDEVLYIGTSLPGQENFSIVEGQMVTRDLTVKVQPRGKVHFTFSKDLSGFENIPTKSVTRQYTFDEIRYVDLTVTDGIHTITWEKVKSKFDYLSSSLTTEDILEAPAGEYRVLSYNTYSSSSILLEHNVTPAESRFTVEDNRTTEADVRITLYESDEYIKDYYALYEIWKSLDGPNWYYNGVELTRGTNWNFDKDPDLWGDQPGVEIYSNGRVAMINLEGYNFAGVLPAAIGQLDQLNQLYLGNHNDPSFLPDDSSSEPGLSTASLFARHKRRMESLHMPTPMSEPIARALMEKGISIPEIEMYKTMTEDQLIDKASGNTIRQIRLMDNIHGVYSNKLTAIDPAIGKLKNLQYLFIANSAIESLPDSFKELTALSDFEIYNCPKMTSFPMVICELPELVSVNISNNAQWSAEEILKGIKGLANGPSAEKIQILYCSQNNLEELPADVKNFKKLGLIDLMSNKISVVHPFGHDIALVDCFLDNNRITEFGRDELGYFCGIEDIETFSASYNRMTQFPDIFNSKSTFYIGTVDFSYNQISSIEHADEGTFKGIKVSTLTLANNPITEFPRAFSDSESDVSYFNLRGCLISKFPQEALENKSMINTTSMDLSYNHLSKLPANTFNGVHLPYLYGLDLGNNRFTEFPFEPLDSAYLTVLSLRSQRDANGNRCLSDWPMGIYQHKGLRGLYLGSNDLRKITDTISPLIYFLDITDNPRITFDASDICYEWRTGAYILLYDKTQNIINCDYMLD